MCGRFTQTKTTDELQKAFPTVDIPEQITPRYNIAPTQAVPVITNQQPEKLDFFYWGLVPHWADDPKIGNRMINARGETLAEKPSFRVAYRRRRCLIIADGFYEWYKRPGDDHKTPMYIQMEDGAPFGFGGLWEIWSDDQGNMLYSCTIITISPNPLVAEYHNRMPFIVPVDQYDTWLAPGEKQPKELDDLINPYPESEMNAYAVSTIVNNPANDVPVCVEPVAQE